MTTYLTFSGALDQREQALQLLARALAPVQPVRLDDGRVACACPQEPVQAALRLLQGWSLWVPPEQVQLQANQLAGALWAATMVSGIGLAALFWALFPHVRETSPLWRLVACVFALAAPSTMALLTFVMPQRPQWGRALRSIRIRGFGA